MAAVATPDAATATPKKSGIDYSRFDNIDDSDDEKPDSSTAKDAKAPVVEEKPHCHNCHKDVTKPLRCGVCKKVSYCSAKCQREDWQFHKRVCQKPAEPKAKSTAKPADSTKAPDKRPKKEEKVVDDDDNITWYRHREWKPEQKQEFKPTQITAQETPEGDTSGSQAGSAWNKAGTWEDKDVTETAKTTLREKLADVASVDIAGGSMVCEGIDELEGEASKPVIRGKVRHMFDMSFKVNFTFRWMDSSGQRQVRGNVTIRDFTNDTFAEGVMSEPEVSISFKDAKMLDEARIKALSTVSWPPEGGSFVAGIASRMQDWANDYTESS